MHLVCLHMDYITAEINNAGKNMISLITILKVLSGFSVPFRVSNVIMQSLLSLKKVLIYLRSQVPNVYAAGLV